MVEALEHARSAMERHAWAEAADAFLAADAAGGLAPDQLEALGTAAWWAARPDESNAALERAFAGYDKANRPSDAARVALTLAYQAFRRTAAPIGAGWLARATHLLEADPDSSVQARLAVFGILGALIDGRLDDAVEIADAAMALARRHGDPNALFSAMSFKGMALVLVGDWRSGVALVDEAATAAASGELDLRVASDIYCNTIAACRTLGDFRRAGQWAEEGERWMRSQSLGGYPGICQVHRAELKKMRGRWSEAEQDARRACEELERFGLLDATAYAHYEVGEIRLRMGDLDAAGEAFERAYEFGHDAQPGMALLHLARGQIDEAARSIGRALAVTAGVGGAADRATRARLLPAQVDIALAAGDLVAAETAVVELESIAQDFQRPVFEAGALTGRGEVLLGEARAAEASPILDRSWRLWRETELPYESARARLRYAEALAAEGDVSAARLDLKAARAAFERLGARLDVARIDALLGNDVAASAAPSRRLTRTFMFTDIVTSTDLIGLIGDEAWSALLAWHDRELRSAFAGHRGEVVKHTGDGFFVAFEQAADAVACAIEIQRRLTQHRREHGFAPTIRIGIHTTEAIRERGDYQGRGVHVAARVGSAAVGEEILISDAAAQESNGDAFVFSEPRVISLKGIESPLEVRSVVWH